MSNESKSFTWLNSYGEEITKITGTDSEIRKVILALGEFILKDDDLKKKNIPMLVEIGEYFWDTGRANAEDTAVAKKFFDEAEKYFDPEATDRLSCIAENPLIADAIWLRAADRNAPSPIDDLQENYREQADYWRKKIAEAEGKSFDSDAPTDEEILDSNRLVFFNIYKRAFAGDPEAMKICLEFCEEEAEYWDNRFGKV